MTGLRIMRWVAVVVCVFVTIGALIVGERAIAIVTPLLLVFILVQIRIALNREQRRRSG